MADPAEKAHRRVEFGGQPFEPFAIAATACNRDHESRSRRPQQCGGPADGVETLAGHEPADAGDELGVVGDAEVVAGRGAFVGGERTEALGVHTGRYDGDRQRATRGMHRLGCRVAAGGDDVAGAAQHVAERLLAGGEAAGHGDLCAMQDDVVGQSQRRTD